MWVLRSSWLCFVVLSVLLEIGVHGHGGSSFSTILPFTAPPVLLEQSHRRADSWHDLRILVDYRYMHHSGLQATPAQVSFIKSKLVPASIQFLQLTLKVRDQSSPQPLSTGKLTCTSSMQECSCQAIHSGTGRTILINIPPEHDPIPPKYDFVLYITAEPPDPAAAAEEATTLAYATTCQYAAAGIPGRNRPIAGVVNFNPASIQDSSDSWDIQLNTATHELLHALGFNSGGFERWSDPITGQKLPATSVFQHESRSDGSTVTTIITPQVKEKVRAHFGCSTAAGAPLEDLVPHLQKPSHWESAIVGNELMSSTISSAGAVLSKMTLAALEDSSWYLPEYSMAGNLMWGRLAGCPMLTEPCLGGGGEFGPVPITPPARGMYCAVQDQTGCTASRTHYGSCIQDTYEGGVIPARYQYWADQPTKAGPNQFMNYCPYYKYYANRRCTSPTTPDGVSSELYGGDFGDNSLCFESTLVSNRLGGSLSIDSLLPDAEGVGCYPIACDFTSSPVEMFIKVAQVWVKCPPEGGGAFIGGFSGQLTCPKPSTVCVQDTSQCGVGPCSGHGSCTALGCRCTSGYSGVACSEEPSQGTSGVPPHGITSLSGSQCLSAGSLSIEACSLTDSGWDFNFSSSGVLRLQSRAAPFHCLSASGSALTTVPCSQTTSWVLTNGVSDHPMGNNSVDINGQSVYDGWVRSLVTLRPSLEQEQCLTWGNSTTWVLLPCDQAAAPAVRRAQLFTIPLLQAGQPIPALTEGFLYTHGSVHASRPSRWVTANCGFLCNPKKAICDAYTGIRIFTYITAAVIGLWFTLVGYRFLKETLTATGFIVGAGLTYPLAFDLLYQTDPTAVWVLCVAVAISLLVGVLTGLATRMMVVGHCLVGGLAGAVLAYIIFALVAFGSEQTGAGRTDFTLDLVFAILTIVLVLLSGTASIWGRRRWFCTCSSLTGVFVLLLSCSMSYTQIWGEDSVSFPDFASVACSCLREESDCRQHPRACTWRPPDDIAANSAAAPSCHRNSPASLRATRGLDLLFLAGVLLLAALAAPFQVKVSAFWFGGSAEMIEEWEGLVENSYEPGQKMRLFSTSAGFTKHARAARQSHEAHLVDFERMEEAHTAGSAYPRASQASRASSVEHDRPTLLAMSMAAPRSSPNEAGHQRMSMASRE